MFFLIKALYDRLQGLCAVIFVDIRIIDDVDRIFPVQLLHKAIGIPKPQTIHRKAALRDQTQPDSIPVSSENAGTADRDPLLGKFRLFIALPKGFKKL